ncbi:HWE histidine kinase domain-containing protein [Rhodopseudomonas sp. BAL398]|uniref:HWE histidine kinase domain-containing protein n=1 Tax=Rhodopseudomonas sp. BAL398 TaxID=3034676 RepID=UPI0039826D6D
MQSFGFLLAIPMDSWVIERCSRNVEDFLAVPAATLIGKPLDTIFALEAVHTIRSHLQSAMIGEAPARVFNIALTAAEARYDLAIHAVANRLVIECERSRPEQAVNAAVLVTSMLGRLEATESMHAFFRVAARSVRALTGFDRVMVYRFDHDESGEVIAEAATQGLEPFLGLHYPASDIPQQARRLYERNVLRIIPDVGAAPSPIEPTLDRAGQPLDLSMSVLRSVSPIHLEYLANMGVAASMSISILRDGKLWGLFACHHYSPHHIGFDLRTTVELFARIFSFQLEARERETEIAYEARAQKLHQRLVTTMAAEAAVIESLVDHLDDIADLLLCDGIGLCIDGRATLKGLTPTTEQFLGLVKHLSAAEIAEVYSSYAIAADYPEAEAFGDRAAGMLVVPLSRAPGDYLIFFRKETLRGVNWAGDPAKPVTTGPMGSRLTPRKSFEIWKETVRGQSAPWLAVERRIAESLRVSLLEVILRLSHVTAKERTLAQNRQELLIAELNHRIRNILSLIRGVVHQSKNAQGSVSEFTAVVGGRIQALARAHDLITAETWGPASLKSLIEAEGAAYLGGRGDRIVVSGPDVHLEPQGFTTVALVLHEMMTNSAKYGALSVAVGRVEIRLALDTQGRLDIHWQEFDGPRVAPPTRRGFGSTVIQRSIPHDLNGEAEVTYALSGLQARFLVPDTYVRTPSATAAPLGRPHVKAEPNEPDGALIPAMKVLLVEDNMIIALDTEELLIEMGAAVTVCSGASAALEEISRQRPDLALLDVNLGVETSFQLAHHLRKIGVPVVFATGYGEQIAFPTEFVDVPRLRKPYSSDDLRKALVRNAPGRSDPLP